jgi:hypothetical protein
MKKYVYLVTGLVAGLLVVTLFLAFVAGTGRAEIGTNVEGQVALQQDGSDETEPPALSGQASALAVPAGTISATLYFAPQDNNGNATYLILYNTEAVTRTAVVEGYNSAGALLVNVKVNIPPFGLQHLISDGLVASPPLSWQSAVSANFTDFTTFGRLLLDPGLHAEGAVVYNPTTGTIDPRADQGAIPLRFSSDPPTIFLPTIIK